MRKKSNRSVLALSTASLILSLVSRWKLVVGKKRRSESNSFVIPQLSYLFLFLALIPRASNREPMPSNERWEWNVLTPLNNVIIHLHQLPPPSICTKDYTTLHSFEHCCLSNGSTPNERQRQWHLTTQLKSVMEKSNHRRRCTVTRIQ